MLLLGAALIGTGSSVFHPESTPMARLASGGRHGFAQSLFPVGGQAGLRRAAHEALRESTFASNELDVVEVDGITLFDEAVALEAIGFAPKGDGLKTLASDRRVNPSGGSAAGYCAPAMGLARIVEATLQLQGRAGAIQLSGARRALASGSSVVAAQTHTAVVLEAQ
jgi:acetyl-CoA acetyltransferase